MDIGISGCSIFPQLYCSLPRAPNQMWPTRLEKAREVVSNAASSALEAKQTKRGNPAYALDKKLRVPSNIDVRSHITADVGDLISSAINNDIQIEMEADRLLIMEQLQEFVTRTEQKSSSLGANPSAKDANDTSVLHNVDLHVGDYCKCPN